MIALAQKYTTTNNILIDNKLWPIASIIYIEEEANAIGKRNYYDRRYNDKGFISSEDFDKIKQYLYFDNNESHLENWRWKTLSEIGNILNGHEYNNCSDGHKIALIKLAFDKH